MSQFSIDLTNVTEKYKDRLDIIVQKVAFDLFAKVIMRSPVDTGRFRANWMIGIDSKPSGTTSAKDAGAVNNAGIGSSKTKQKVQAKLATIKAGVVIWLVNNLPYADRLEEGWSPQASGGIVGISVAEFKGIVNKISRQVKT